MAADLLIFDPERVRDRADFSDPLQYSEGMDYVLVNGIPVLREVTEPASKAG